MKYRMIKSYREFSVTEVLRKTSIIGVIFSATTMLSLQSPISDAHAQRPDKATSSKSGDAKKGEKSAKKGKSKRRGGRRGRRGPATVFVDAVTKGTAVETIQVYGRVLARQTGVVASRTRGAIDSVTVHVGDRVKKGDVIATLVADMLTAERSLKAAELKEFSAKIRTAGAQLRLSAQELERLERLRKSSAFSVARYQDKLRDVERFRSALAEARAKQEQARAELRMADINLYNAKVLAPFDGVVTKRTVEAGNYVSVGSPVVTMLNEKSLEVEAEVPANRLGGLTNGIQIDVKPEFGKSFKASVRAIVPEENALSRTRAVRFTPTFIAVDDTVAANQSVVLHIPSGAAKIAVTVHKDAITQRRGKRVVFVAKKTVEGLRADMRQVTLGDAFGLRFEVLKGLKPGDKVVVRGNERLRPRQKIKISTPGARKGGGSWGGKRGRGGKGGWKGRKGRNKGGKRGPRGESRRGTPKSAQEG
ncbi:MAG: efflux RND transporter periplasmic adaptor subunit [Alphaproteobacteria bacterium]|nr:efflux RND transporter periplasmic adaptor subunit [Alphaproteobacteria bacterium]